jgi:hypothetical protein
VTPGDVWAFYFHPEDLTPDGIACFAANLARLRRVPGVEFLTASGMLERWACDRPPGPVAAGTSAR